MATSDESPPNRLSQLIERIKAMPVDASPTPLADIVNQLFLILINRDEKYSDSLCSNQFASSIWSIAVEAARVNMSADDFSVAVIGSGGDGICEIIVNSYTKYADALREAMLSIGWEYQKVISIDWGILSVVESNDNNVEIEEPLAEITFKTLATGETSPDEFKFLCNKNQLLDLQFKVKTSHNFIQKLISDNQ